MIAFFVGLIAFSLAGFGLGGGVLLIPFLTKFFSVGQSAAQYIALIAYLPAAMAIIIISLKENKQTLEKILPLIPSGIIGAIIGALISQSINVDYLRKIYGAFAIIVGINMLLGVLKSKKILKERDFNPNI